MQQKRHVAHELQDHVDRAVDEPVPREPGDPHREPEHRRRGDPGHCDQHRVEEPDERRLQVRVPGRVFKERRERDVVARRSEREREAEVLADRGEIDCNVAKRKPRHRQYAHEHRPLDDDCAKFRIRPKSPPRPLNQTHRERSSRRASPRPSTEAPVHAAVTGVTAEGRHPAIRRSSGPPRPSRPEGGTPRFASCRPIAALGPSSLGTDQPVVRADAIARGAVAGSALWVRSPVLSALARVRGRYGSALLSARVREFEDGGNPGCEAIALRRVEFIPVFGELAQKRRESGVADRNRFRSHPGGGTPTSGRNGIAEPRNGGMPQTS